MANLSSKKLRAWCRKARQLWPLDKPVRVMRCVTPWCRLEDGTKELDAHTQKPWRIAGQCYERKDCYVIQMRRDLCKAAVLDTLLHEWAHLLRGEVEPNDPGLHDDTFFCLMGELYRTWHRTQ